MKTAEELGLTPSDTFVHSSRIGDIDGVPYNEMVRRLGQPNQSPSGDGKVDLHWVMITENLGFLAIWNWKNGPSYYGYDENSPNYQMTLEQISEWSCWWSNDWAYNNLIDLFAGSFHPDGGQ